MFIWKMSHNTHSCFIHRDDSSRYCICISLNNDIDCWDTVSVSQKSNEMKNNENFCNVFFFCFVCLISWFRETLLVGNCSISNEMEFKLKQQKKEWQLDDGGDNDGQRQRKKKFDFTMNDKPSVASWPPQSSQKLEIFL